MNYVSAASPVTDSDVTTTPCRVDMVYILPGTTATSVVIKDATVTKVTFAAPANGQATVIPNAGIVIGTKLTVTTVGTGATFQFGLA